MGSAAIREEILECAALCISHTKKLSEWQGEDSIDVGESSLTESSSVVSSIRRFPCRDSEKDSTLRSLESGCDANTPVTPVSEQRK